MSDIPDGADTIVAKMAIAWEIAKKSLEQDIRPSGILSGEKTHNLLVDYFNKAFYNLMSGAPKEK